VVSSSSTRRAARLAQKGKGRRVRFQGGTFFPLVIMIILVVGLGTIVYARQSQPEAEEPTADDHWHHAYGFSLCDRTDFFQLGGAKEETDANGQLISSAFLRTGVHSHDDGVIHWHPYTSAAVGDRARLGVFLDVYDVELTDDTLRFPAEQGGQEFVEGETTCNGQPGELKVVAWDNFRDTGAGTTYVSNFDDIRLDKDGMVVSIAFQPPDTVIAMPPWASNLPALGAVDQGAAEPGGSTVPPEGSLTPSSEGTAPDATTDGATSTTADATTSEATTSTATTAPSTSAASTTTG
jgi:hypothetical protein